MHHRPVFDITKAISVVSERHGNFVDKYGKWIEQCTNQRNLNRATVQSRIALVASVLHSAKVIDSYAHVDVLGYPQSIKITPKAADLDVYLLNDCDSVIAVAGEVAGVLDTFSARLAASADDSHGLYNKWHRVLGDDFDWESLCVELLDLIHRKVYCRHEAISNSLSDQSVSEDK